MPTNHDDFLKKLLATFKIEADEHLKAMSDGLLELQQMPACTQQADIIERIFREAHSLKGAARAVNLTQVESVCQALESIFAALKGKKIVLSSPLFDLMQEALAELAISLFAKDEAMAIAKGAATLTKRLEDALKNNQPYHPEPTAPENSPRSACPAPPADPPPPMVASGIRLPSLPRNLSETVRVSTTKLAAVMRQAEELLPAKLSTGQRAVDLDRIEATLASWKKQRADIQPLLRAFERSPRRNGKNNAGKKQQELTRLLEYLDAENHLIKTLENQITGVRKSSGHDHRALDGMVDGLLQSLREMLMLPFSSLLETFPHFVRELAHDQGKEIELEIQGSNIEIDRRILEEMKDPFIHLLRNSVDHGIEKPADRLEKQKPPGGTICLAIIQQDGGKVEIIVSDDGAGIDLEKVKAAAVRQGLVSSEEFDKLGEQEALALIFKSGVSTSPTITELSGRGLGLAIAKETVERLGGTIAIAARPGVNTTFRIVLPLTLATFRGVLVRAAGQNFILPLHNLECVVRLAWKEIQTVENRETIPLNGRVVSLVRLAEVLELAPNAAGDNRPKDETDGNIQAAILGLGATHIAFQVDEVIGEQEVLVKMLGRQLARVRNVAGACVLGAGQVVPVLNVADLMKSALRQTTAKRASMDVKTAKIPQRSILVVEDSITSRSLLKNILESAGYHVTTAVDGLDAYTILKTGTFDLVVSDVEMPRMNGFDLTAKIRSDKLLAELPVVLVTALESREHRECGIDV
ncbi:MAG: response regulator, partial [Methylococcaceae bacterium]|nr:response regulator [Methylococcaceae bacterium]